MIKTCIVIAGPTAVGKTDVSIGVAQKFNAAIISADSRQCFSELNIGVARPDKQQLEAVPHYFIASLSIHESVNAVSFEAYALEKLTSLFEDNEVVVVTGGTGLYIKALCDGLDQIPEVPTDTRTKIIEGYEKGGLPWLAEMLENNDPVFAAKGEMQNPQRMMRALEVAMATGSSILDFQKSKKQSRPFRIIKVALELPRTSLQNRIDKRVDLMMASGLLEEVRSLSPYRYLNALQTVGYSELFDYFDGKHDMETAIELIKIHTRQYAKRQMTWFKKDKDFIWLDPSDPTVVEKISSLVFTD